MKSIMTSVSPYLCEKIASGDCKILVKKSAPKEVPFKDYIYCTKAEPFIQKIRFGDIAISHTQISKNLYNGKVIGEFICDEVDILFNDKGNPKNYITDILPEILKYTALSYDEFARYVGSRGTGRSICGWHISDLKIYDKPKELSEFKTPPCEKPEKACGNCKWLVKINTPDIYECECYVEDGRPITRPSSSWQYVEELRNE